MTSAPTGSIEQHYKTLVLHFKRLHGVQDVFAKIGHLPGGSTKFESKIFNGLKALKPLIPGGDPLTINAKMSAIESQLREYDEWIELSNNTLTPYGLRQYIHKKELNRDDLMGLARYLSNKQSNLPDDRGKLELILSELGKEMSVEEEEQLLAELFPEPPQLTYASQELLEQLRSLNSQLESIKTFPQLIDGEYMARARRLKMDLGAAMWHPEALSVLGTLNLTLEGCFRNLFKSERSFITEACQRLLSAGINSVGRLGENGVLNIDAAIKFAENAEGLLEQNYQTNMQRLQQLARIGQWLRHALETLEARSSKKQKVVERVQRPIADRDSTLVPISTVLDYANIGAMEQQISSRIDEISQVLWSRPRRSGVEVIQLKRTILLLGEWEILAMVSLGNIVEASRRQQYDLIRRAISLIAELQESAVVFAESNSKDKKERHTSLRKSNNHYSVPATVYFLEQCRRTEGEIETMSQTARQNGEIEMALNLLATRGKLQDVYQKVVIQFKNAGLDLQ
jgi:hypothetical protein